MPLCIPVAGEGFAGCRLGLGNFVFVVGKDQVAAPGVDVNGRAEAIADHRRAFNVPAGATRTPGGFPKGFAFFGCFPQGEVEGVLFDSRLAGYPSAGSGLHVFQLAAREFAVTLELADGVIDIPISGVGVAFFLLIQKSAAEWPSRVWVA